MYTCKLYTLYYDVEVLYNTFGLATLPQNFPTCSPDLLYNAEVLTLCLCFNFRALRGPAGWPVVERT